MQIVYTVIERYLDKDTRAWMEEVNGIFSTPELALHFAKEEEKESKFIGENSFDVVGWELDGEFQTTTGIKIEEH